MRRESRPVIFLGKEDLIERYYQAMEDARSKYGSEGLEGEKLKSQFEAQMRILISQKSEGTRISNVKFDTDMPSLKRNLDQSDFLHDTKENDDYENRLLSVIWDETIRFLAGK